MDEEVIVTKKGKITIVTINRPNVRNAVNYKTSKMLEKPWKNLTLIVNSMYAL